MRPVAVTIDSSAPETVDRQSGIPAQPGPADTPGPPTDPAPSVPARPRGLRRVRISAPAGAVLLLALCSFVGSLLLQAFLYPRGSGDADEAAYVLQARMLLDGRLTLDARVVEPFFQPWLTGIHGNHVFTKYLPGWPALLALSQALFGTMTVAPAAAAACWVVGAYLLARELFDDVWTALAAAVLLALSPLVLLHTALPLAYACCAAVLTLASALLLRGAHTGSRPALIGGGALVGFALLNRPYDVVLVALPLVLFVAARQRRTPRALLTRSVWAALGAAPLVAVLLAYCWYVTGSPLRLPLSASDPLDTFGFGPRRILPTESSFPFTRHLAEDALWDTLGAAPSWYFGGLGLIALAAVGLLAPRRRAERLLLLATTGVVLAGYFFWWGSAFAVPGLRNGLGPHYHLAGFTPVVILAAAGARWLWTLLPARPRVRRAAHSARPVRCARVARLGGLARPTAVALSVAGLAALTVPTLQPRIDVQHSVDAGNDFLDALVPDDLPGPALVVVTPGVTSRYTQVPYHTLRNSPGLDGPIVYAADIGPGIAALPDRMPGRALYRLRPDELVDADIPGSYRGSFVPLRRVTGTRVEIRVTIRPPAGAAGGSATAPAGGGSRMYVRLGGEVRSLDLAAVPLGGSAGTVTHTFVLTTGAAGGPDEIAAGASSPAELVVGFAAGGEPGSGGWEERFPLVRRAAGDLSLLAPGLGWRRLPGGTGGTGGGKPDDWLAARIQPVLDVALAGSGGR
ncbi:DUF6541 family protein [Pseudofrankia sp. BMG5.36]|uniref:DUF6541 family protein n=1 Tax=Pseudofrankia sp. BMG5.36 TaxID=1834512 RepID=UPI0009F3B2C3|nr:DUF6541 family protein [Pseudofrankia sp. BMG5.36]